MRSAARSATACWPAGRLTGSPPTPTPPARSSRPGWPALTRCLPTRRFGPSSRRCGDSTGDAAHRRRRLSRATRRPGPPARGRRGGVLGAPPPAGAARRGRHAVPGRRRPSGPWRARHTRRAARDGRPAWPAGPARRRARPSGGRRPARHPRRGRGPPAARRGDRPAAARRQGGDRVDEPGRPGRRALGARRPVHRVRRGEHRRPWPRRRQDAAPAGQPRRRDPADAGRVLPGGERVGRVRRDGDGRAAAVHQGRRRPRSAGPEPGCAGAGGHDRRGARQHVRVHLAEAAGNRRGSRGGRRVDAAVAAARWCAEQGSGGGSSGVGRGAEPAGGSRAGGRTGAALPGGRRRRRSRRRGRTPAAYRAVGSAPLGRHRDRDPNGGGPVSKLHVPWGRATDGRDPLVITPGSAGWTYAGLEVIQLRPGEAREIAIEGVELAVVPLRGGARVAADGHVIDLAGRPSVFAAVTDLAYVPLDAALTVSSVEGAELALATARATRRFEAAYIPVSDVPVEVRGAGRATRQVNDLLAPGSSTAVDKLCVVEVLTPDGNWSSYPPHKHDT